MTATTFILLASMVMPGRPDVTKSIFQIHSDAFDRHVNFEQALLVRKDSVDFASGSQSGVYFKWDNSILAVIHTHLDKGEERPSREDIDTAKIHNIPVYVVSEFQIWCARPDGKVEQIGQVMP